MKIKTQSGDVEVDSRQLFHFPYGLYAFEELRHFALIDSAYLPFYWLQSLERSELSFLLLSPEFLISDYSIQQAALEDFSSIGLQNHEDQNLLFFSIVTLHDYEPEISTVNMQGPIIFNKAQNLGRQIIVGDERWSVRYRLADLWHNDQ